MAYTFERFGTITLPIYNREINMAPVSASLRIVGTAAGAFDSDGTARSGQSFPHALTVEAVVSEDTTAEQRTAIDALRAAVGTRAYLYRVADSDAAVHRALCRLTAMTQDRHYEQRRAYQPIRLQFAQLTGWQGATHGTWYFDEGEVFDDGLDFDTNDYLAALTASPASQVVANGGNYPLTDVVFTVTAGAAALSNVVLYAAGMDLRWDGSIPAGQALVIDCGAASVQLAGIDAYSDFYIGPTHTIEDWFRLEPGNTTIGLSVIGTLTGASWSVSFRDRWA